MSDANVSGGLQTLQSRAKFAEYAIYAALLFFMLTLVGEVLELTGVINLMSYQTSTLTDVYTIILIGTLPAFIISVIAICMWIYRAHANLHESGIEGLNTSPGWAVGWYFIPFANLIMPFKSMKELWNESHRLEASYSDSAPGNITFWWAMWIIGNILSNISTRMTLTDGPNYDVGVTIAILGSICTIAAAFLILRIIQEITQAQASHHMLAEVFE